LKKFTNWLVAILTPILLEQSAYGAYFLFGGLALGTVAVLFVYMPETRGRSLESIQEAFYRPTMSLKTISLGLSDSIRLRRQHKQQSDEEFITLSQQQQFPTQTSSVAPSLRLDLSTT